MIETLAKLESKFSASKPQAVDFYKKLGWLCDLEFTNAQVPAYPVINIATNLKIKL